MSAEPMRAVCWSPQRTLDAGTGHQFRDLNPSGTQSKCENLDGASVRASVSFAPLATLASAALTISTFSTSTLFASARSASATTTIAVIALATPAVPASLPTDTQAIGTSGGEMAKPYQAPGRRPRPTSLPCSVSRRTSSTDRMPRRAAPAHSRVFTVDLARRSLAEGTASAYCGSHRAWVTSMSSTICQTSSGVQMAPTSGSCSIASFNVSTSPAVAALTAMRWTLIDARQVAAQASDRVRPAAMLRPNLSTKPVDKASRLPDGISWKIRDKPTILHVEMSAMRAAGFERFDDVRESQFRTSFDFQRNIADTRRSHSGSSPTCRFSDGFPAAACGTRVSTRTECCDIATIARIGSLSFADRCTPSPESKRIEQLSVSIA